ncbi:AT-hook motif nuclear-localized protein 10-like [Lotus japonicus]|uniref:AT-hook motif nuclear-localized protein 10-like n=1 Tax=Lotus japonicus TaxID=34305 RepID=UPI0025906A62|nr:AT-hook motif nuclear-localized protein 10-like [Lotus japonicus]
MEDLNQIVMMSHAANSSKNELEPNKEEVTTHTATGDIDIAPHGAKVEVALKLVTGEASEATGSGHVVKRGRGRPRKYKVNESQLTVVTAQPPVFAIQPYGGGENVKRSRGRPRGSTKPQIPTSIMLAGRGFTSHVVDVNTGEDVMSKITPFYQAGPLSVSLLFAHGHVSSVAFLQPDSNNLLRYEGYFQIISLNGSCTYSTEVGGPLTKTFKFAISLLKPDGEMFGGNITSSLIAAGPVRLILATFKQNISNHMKRRQSCGSSTASNIPGNPDSARGDLHKVPRMTKGEIICPTPISAVLPTSSTDGITETPPLS